MRWALIGKAALILVLLASIAYPTVSAQNVTLSYVYKLYGDGTASVTVVLTGLTGLVEYSFPVSEKVVNESLVAFDEQGDIVLATYNGTHITVYPMNATDKVIVQYEAVVGTITVEGLVSVNITVKGQATLVLPEGAGLIYFNDNPDIEVIGETIKLKYTSPGLIQVEFIPPLPATTTTTTTTTSPTTTTQTSPTPTSPPSTNTTTQTTVTETKTQTTQITTSSPTSSPSTSPVTTTTKTTTTTQTQASSPATTTTKTETTTLTTSPTPTTTTSMTPSITQTSTTTTTSPSTSSTTTPSTSPTPTATTKLTTPTTTTQPTSGFPTIVIVFIAVIIALLIGGVVAYKKFFTKSFSSPTPQIPSHSPPSSGGITLTYRGELDERDRTILKALSEKPMSISELARSLGLSKSTVWRRVRRLERNGYVKTREEGNKTIIELTDKARREIG